MNNTIALSCEGLVKSFNEGESKVDVLKGVNLSVTQGECVAIVGSSGSGKSTLLHLLGGLEEPCAGEVTIVGHLMHKLSEEKRGHVRNQNLGFVYQFHHLLSEFSALENVAMPLLIRGEEVGSVEESAIAALKQVGLADRILHKPGELSGGERQRAAIARALITKPKCILADEPTGNLDEHTAEQVFDAMLYLNRFSNVSLVMVTHNIQLAHRFDRMQTLHSGIFEDALN